MSEIHTFTVAPGVELWWLPTTKFHVARLEVNFLTPQHLPETTARKMLANLLQRSSADWPTEALLSRQLAGLYGAELVARTTILQNLNILSVAISSALEYRQQEIFESAQQLLWNCLWRPNLDEQQQQFAANAFKIEQVNLNHAYESIADDYPLQASLALRQLVYQNVRDLAIPAFGTLEQLQQLTPIQVRQQYDNLLKNNRIIITLVGAVPTKTVQKVLTALQNFSPRQQKVAFRIKDLKSNSPKPLQQTKIEPLQQSQLALAYQTSGRWSVLQVLNMMFGGDDQSLLFQQVREHHGLAYSIYSNVNTYQQLIYVQAGVDGSQVSLTETLIKQQIARLTQENLTELLHHAQLALINQRLELADTIAVSANRLLLKALNPQAIIDDQQYIQEIKRVQLADVQAAAQQLHKIAGYYLIGQDKG